MVIAPWPGRPIEVPLHLHTRGVLSGGSLGSFRTTPQLQGLLLCYVGLCRLMAALGGCGEQVPTCSWDTRRQLVEFLTVILITSNGSCTTGFVGHSFRHEQFFKLRDNLSRRAWRPSPSLHIGPGGRTRHSQAHRTVRNIDVRWRYAKRLPDGTRLAFTTVLQRQCLSFDPFWD